MRKNVKNLAKCGEKSYVECRTKCDKRNSDPKCDFLKRRKNVDSNTSQTM